MSVTSGELSKIILSAKKDITNKGSFYAGNELCKYIRKLSCKDISEYVTAFDLLLTDEIKKFMLMHAERLDSLITTNFVKSISWLSANTFRETYLTKLPNSDRVESIELCWMRVACFHAMRDGIDAVEDTYVKLLNGYYTVPSPVIFNAGKVRGTECSCFLLKVEDNFTSIMETQHAFSQLSASGGGVGIQMAGIRNTNLSTGGKSAGMCSYGKLYDGSVSIINQNGHRKAALTMFCNWYSMEVMDFVSRFIKSKTDHERTYMSAKGGIYISYLFYKRVKEGKDITLFCPKYTRHIDNLYCDAFNEAYTRLESDPSVPSNAKEVIPARELFRHIVSARIKNGAPFLLNLDSASFRSNHRMGEVPHRLQSNLCIEMYMRIPTVTIGNTKKNLIAVCNLSSINLEIFVKGKYAGSIVDCIDFPLLSQTVRRVVRNVNNSIEQGKDPLGKNLFVTIASNPIRTVNELDRALGIGVMGFADMVYELDLLIDSEDVAEINKVVFACIYWNCIVESVRLAIEKKPHKSFSQTPLSKGKFDFDLWNEETEYLSGSPYLKSDVDLKIDTSIVTPIEPSAWGVNTVKITDTLEIDATWKKLSYAVMTHGTHNSLFTALMPTATSSQCRGLTESVELPQSVLYSRNTLSGTYLILDRHFERDMREIGLWGEDIVTFLVRNDGSVQGILDYLKDNRELSREQATKVEWITSKYRTSFEVSQSVLINLMKDRSPYISHGASLSSFFGDSNPQDEAQFIGESLRARNKTIVYYRRGGQQATATEPTEEAAEPVEEATKPYSRMECTDEVCTSCSS